MGQFETRYAAMTATALHGFLAARRAVLVESTAADRSRTVSVVEQALLRRSRRLAQRTTVRRCLGLMAATAAAVVVAVWAVGGQRTPSMAEQATMGHRERALTILGEAGASPLPGSAIVEGHGPAAVPLRRGMELEAGTGLVAPTSGEVRIGTADGTLLTLEQSSELVLGEQTLTRRFSLKRGSVRVRVSKLQAGERFIVSTDDADVEVHGTVFRVSVAPDDATCAGGIRTRVSVQEGIVSVRAGEARILVPAGATWPAGCLDPPTGAVDDEPLAAGAAPRTVGRVAELRRGASRGRAAAAAVVHRTPARGVGSSPAVVSSVDPDPAGEAPESVGASDLAVQNDLFAAAVHARRRHGATDAVRLFSELIRTYPDGPLTEGAMAQRMRLLAAGDAQGAARAATEYLARFPAGFARVEARRLAAGAPP